MKKALLFLFFLLTAWAVTNEAQASHVMGSDIVYRCLGNGKYEVVVRVYRDCNGIQVSQSNVVARCSSNTVTISSQTKVSQRDITGIDPNCPVQSRCQSTNFQYGIEEHVWKMTLDLSSYSCCEWTLSWEQCCRNGAITTGQSNQNFFTTATLNKCVSPCNSSPDFTNPPIAIVCHNQDFVFNNGALDTIDSGDSLSYELVNGLQGLNQSVTYSGNFSPTRPLTFFGFPNQNLQWPAGFHLDPLTGDLMFRPTQQNQIAIVVIEVKEWRKVNGTMQVVGRTRRDMQIIIVPCPNNKAPKILPPYSVQACAGQKTCITIATDDDDTDDTVRITWNRGIRDATFTNNNGTVKHASGEVCWTPDENDISNIPYTFTITARDDACPLAGQGVRAFSIFVRETPHADLSAQVLTCGKVAINHTPKKSYAGYTFNYVIRDSLNKGVWASNQQVDTAFLQPGVYMVYLNMRTSTPCLNIAVDSIVIPEFVRIDVPTDTVICAGIPITINSVTTNGDSPYEYEWRMVGDTADSVLTTAENITINPDTFKRFAIQVKDNNGCFNYDTVDVNWYELPPVNLGPDQRVCSGTAVQLDGGNDSLVLSYLWSTGDTTRKIWVQDSANYAIRVLDTVGCYNYDTLQFRVNNPIPELGPDQWRCEKDTITLTAVGADTYKWYYADLYNPNGTNTPIGTNPSLDYIVSQTRTLLVEGRQTYMGVSCTNFDSVKVNMNPLPDIVFSPKGPHCPDAGPVALLTYIQFPTLFTGTWRSDVNSDYVKNGIFYPSVSGSNPNPGHPVVYRVTDNNGCTRESTTYVKVSNLPTFTLQDSIAVCGDAADVILSNLLSNHQPVPTLGTPVWSSLNGNPTVDANIVKTPATQQKLKVSNLPQGIIYPIKYRFTQTSTGCSGEDTVYVRVKTVPNTDAGVLPQYCWNDAPIDLDNEANPTPAGGIWTTNMGTLNGSNFVPSSVGASQKFVPSTPVTFTYEYTQEGCTKSDDVATVIKGIPDIQMNPLNGICEDSLAINLNNRATPYSLGAGIWSGPGVQSNKFTAADAGVGFHFLVYNYQDPVSRCKNLDSFRIEVQAKPDLQFQSPPAACAGESFKLDVTLQNAIGFRWTTLGDGEFDAQGSGSSTSTNVNTEYFPGPVDINTEGFTILGETTNPRFCQPARVNQNVKIFPIPVVSIAEPLDDCAPLEIDFEATTDAAPGYRMEWSFGDGATRAGVDLWNPTHTYSDPNTYTINVTVQSDTAFGLCRSDATPVDVIVFPTPSANFTANRFNTTVALPGIQFEDKSTINGGGSITEWSWSFGDRNNATSNIQNPFHEYPITDPTDTGTFPVLLRVATPDGCWDTITKYIHIGPDITVFIPNAFTPNGFGESMNDRFYVFADGYETFEITIFNRWGEKMYYSNNIKEGWDGMYKGTEAQQDVYMYVVRVTSLAGKEFEYYGTITLLR